MQFKRRVITTPTPALMLLLCILGAGTAWSGVQPPLEVTLQGPEDGFRTGEAAELLLSSWIPEIGLRDEVSIKLTLAGSGVAQVSGQSEWLITGIKPGEVRQVSATVFVSGNGEGEWHLQAQSFDAEGNPRWARSAHLFVLQADNEILHGKSSDYHLREQKIQKDLEAGRLNKSQFQRELEKLNRGEELKFQKELKGLPTDEVPPAPAIPKVVDTTLVSGQATYTQRTGRAGAADQFATAENARPLTEMLVEFYDKQGEVYTKLATSPAEVRTNATGNYANVTVPGKRPDETAVNLEVRFKFDSPAASIGAALDTTSYVPMPLVVVDDATLEVNLVVDNSNMDRLRRAHLHEMALFCYDQTRALVTKMGVGAQPQKIRVHFPNPAGPNGSYFWTVGGNHIAMGRNHGFDWDVFTHEYGHYLQELNDTARNPGGQHFIDGNLAGFRQVTRDAAGNITWERTLTKEQGIQMAWAEGWPTYFGTFLQIAGGAGSTGIHTVGDLMYTDTANNFAYHLEENASLSRPRGEDVELAVQRILWDFADQPQDENDEVVFGHERLWTLLHSAPKPLTLNDFRAKMNDEVPPTGVGYYSTGSQEQNRVRYGAIYHDLGVGPAPTAPADGFTGGTPPKFTWQRKGAGPNPSYRFSKFNVVFYDKDFDSIVFTSPEIPTAAGVLTNAQNAEWTPTQEQWDQITAHGEILHWGVQGSHDGPPVTGPYLGLTRRIGGASIAFVIDDTGSMWNEIAGVRGGLTLFIDILRAFDLETNPLIEVITFKDNVTHRIASRDLDAVQAVVSSLYADGGADCPEASAQALSAAVKNVTAGGTIIFATDASPHRGYDLGRVKSNALAKGIIINQFVSGDCDASSPDKSDGNDLEGSCNPGYILEPESLQTVEYWSDVFCLDCPEDDSMGRAMTPNILKLVGDWTLPPVGSVVAFTDLASASPKGHFLYMPEVKWGISTPFVNAVTNAALSAVAPTVLATQPSSGPQGGTMDVLILGGSTNFRNTSLVSFSGPGISVNEVMAISETEIVANITIDAEADLGFRDVSVTTSLGPGTVEAAGGTGQFEVVTAPTFPTMISVSPKMIAQGTTITLTIYGINTNFAAGETEVIFGEGITVDSLSVVSAVKLEVQITAAADAPTGFRKLTVQTDDEVLVLNNAIALVETLGLAEGAPAIESVSPRDLPRGAMNLPLTVAGRNTHFVDGETVVNFSGAGITVTSTVVVSETEVQVHVDVAPNAALGARDVTASTGGETAALVAGVVVVDSGLDDGCCGGCSGSGNVKHDMKRFLGDYLLFGVSFLALVLLTASRKRD